MASDPGRTLSPPLGWQCERKHTPSGGAGSEPAPTRPREIRCDTPPPQPAHAGVGVPSQGEPEARVPRSVSALAYRGVVLKVAMLYFTTTIPDMI